jgi:Tol biopolymer transport system component
VLTNVYSEVETESEAWLGISDNGTAVYAPGSPAKCSLAWVDREGKAESLHQDQDVYREVRISLDGSKAIVRHGLELWVQDLQRGTSNRLTAPLGSSNIWPVWSRDGASVIFASNRGGNWDIYSQPSDGSGPAEVMLKRPHDQFPVSMAADGTVLYSDFHPQTARDLWILSPDGKTSPVRVSPSNEMAGQFSPESPPRRIAYTSDESGRYEVYVQSYPSGANRVAVSNEGGISPQWSRDGKELYYVSADAIMSCARSFRRFLRCSPPVI